ncbi:MAG: iron-sulfur cluster repair di-iron protein [Flavobacteriales bacterium]
MEISKEKTVAEFVRENIKTTDIFYRYGIDYCCGGGISIEEACKRKNIGVEELLKQLEIVNKEVIQEDVDYKSWALDDLINHIVQKHHQYVRESIPVIIQYSDKVAKVHGKSHPEVIKINKLFHEVAKELTSHMQKEENILFPYIADLLKVQEGTKENQIPPFGTVNNPIRMMIAEHEEAGSLLSEIARLSSNYTPHEEACNTFRALYSKLKEFEQDLHIHIHLENNILFIRAIELEEQLSGK